MTVNSYEDLMVHIDHQIRIINYHDENVTIACMFCNEVLTEFDKEPGKFD